MYVNIVSTVLPNEESTHELLCLLEIAWQPERGDLTCFVVLPSAVNSVCVVRHKV